MTSDEQKLRDRLIPIKDRPGWSWFDGDDPIIGQWIPVETESFVAARLKECPHDRLDNFGVCRTCGKG